MTNAKSWILATRPKTLTAAVVPIVACTGLVMSEGYLIQWWIIVCALMASFFIQIGTNLVNDAMDHRKGADTETRLGPKRVTQQGIFTFKQVMLAATICFAISILFGIPLVFHGGVPIALIGLCSVAMGYAYTSGPFPLAYRGMGDLFVIFFFGIIAVGGMYYLLSGNYSWSALVLGLQIGFLSTVLIAINNLRDIHQDKLVNKKTLAVRLGVGPAKAWICFLIVAPFLVGYYWLFTNRIYLYVVPVLCLPLGMTVMKKIIRSQPSAQYNTYLAMSSGYALLFSILFLVGTRI